MFAACRLAKNRFLDVVGRYGRAAVEQAGRAWIDYSEHRLRAEIAKVPDGVYETEMGYQLPLQIISHVRYSCGSQNSP